MQQNRRRPRLLIVGPLPPPLGGVQLMIEMQLRSGLATEFQLGTVDTSKRQLRWAVENPTWRTPLYFVRDFFRLIGALARVRPDAVLVHAAPSLSFLRDWVMMVTSRMAGAKVICHYHGTTHTRFPSCETPRGRLIGRMLMRAANRVIVLGPTYQFDMGAAWRRSDVAWAPNLVDTALFAPPTAAEAAPGAGATPIVLFVGRLSAPKGIWDLFDAMPAVIARFPAAKFALMGVAEDIAREDHLRSEVVRRNLSGHIEFLGSLEGRSKALAFMRSTLLVVPSWTEAFPLVIPEGMAAGLPIIATAVGAVPDFVKNGVDGLLIPPRNPPLLAAGICKILEDDGLRVRMGSRVKARASAEFAIDIGCERVAEVIRAALERR